MKRIGNSNTSKAIRRDYRDTSRNVPMRQWARELASRGNDLSIAWLKNKGVK